MTGDLARALFAPRAVALVGASGDVKKNTARPQRYLRKHGFTGRVVPINPGRETVLDEPAYPSISAAPGPIDHALIMVPAAAVAGVIEDCIAAGVKVAAIYSDGFAEAGADGIARQAEIVRRARDGGLRLIGPNSMGVIDTHEGAAITVNAALELDTLPRGGIGVISHSGTILGTLISRGAARGFGFSRMVALGNEADISMGEVGEMMIDDPHTEAIALFLETVRDPDSLGAMARRAHSASKPVIAYKLGRSGVGRALVLSHSGAIAGSDAAADAFFRHHGILRVDMLETLFEIVPLVKGRRPPAGRRVAVVTTTGGGAAMVVDRLGALGIETLPAPAELVALMAPKGIHLGKGPVIDLTMVGARADTYGAALETLTGLADCDAVVAVVGSSAQFHPDLAVEPIRRFADSVTPVVAFLVPHADESLRLLGEAGIAGFRTPEACADGVSAFLNWETPAPTPPPRGDLAPVEAAIAGADRPVLDELESRGVFAALGIAQAEAERLESNSGPSPLPYPVALKALANDMPHRSEHGGVALNVSSHAELAAAAREIRSRIAAAFPDRPLKGLLVQAMTSGVAEVLIGYRDDPGAGPMVVVGAGGVLAELQSRPAMRVAPVDADTARTMIGEVATLAPLFGYRGSVEGDVTALAEAIAALSELARLPGRPVAEAEINPIVVRAAGGGAIAVDGLVVLKAAP